MEPYNQIISCEISCAIFSLKEMERNLAAHRALYIKETHFLCSIFPKGSFVFCSALLGRPSSAGADFDRISLPWKGGISRLGPERSGSNRCESWCLPCCLRHSSGLVSYQHLCCSLVVCWDEWSLDGFPQRNVPFLRLLRFSSLSLQLKFCFEVSG